MSNLVRRASVRKCRNVLNEDYMRSNEHSRLQTRADENKIPGNSADGAAGDSEAPLQESSSERRASDATSDSTSQRIVPPVHFQSAEQYRTLADAAQLLSMPRADDLKIWYQALFIRVSDWQRWLLGRAPAIWQPVAFAIGCDLFEHLMEGEQLLYAWNWIRGLRIPPRARRAAIRDWQARGARIVMRAICLEGFLNWGAITPSRLLGETPPAAIPDQDFIPPREAMKYLDLGDTTQPEVYRILRRIRKTAGASLRTRQKGTTYLFHRGDWMCITEIIKCRRRKGGDDRQAVALWNADPQTLQRRVMAVRGQSLQSKREQE